MTREELIELLAAKVHESWAHWMRYQLSLCTQAPDGSMTIPAELVTRWQVQVTTEYAALSEQEQQADRNRVAKIMPIIEEYTSKEEKR